MTKPPGASVCLALSALALALSSSVRVASSPVVASAPVAQGFSQGLVAQGFLPTVALAQVGSPAVALAQTGSSATTDQTPAAVLAKYCITCHNEKRKTAGLMIDKLDLQQVGDDAEVWEKVARKLRTQEMPPPGAPRPDKATYTAVTTQLENALDAAATANPNPGRVAVHRLNRTEYTNAIRDLLDLEIDGRSVLSTDGAEQEGFDNVASVLTVSPALLENYLTAARMISRLAVGDTARKPMIDSFKVERLMVQDDRMSEDLPFGSRGGVAIPYQFPVDGEYLVKIELWRQLYDYIIGMGEPHQLDIRLDGVLLKRFTVGGEGKGMTAPENFAGNTQGDPEWEKYMHTADEGLEVRARVTAGPHTVGVSFVRRLWEPEGIVQPPQTGFSRTTDEHYFGNPRVKTVSIGGPFKVLGPGESPARRKVFVCSPKDTESELPCARKILSALATRAYRRPVTETEMQVLLDFYKAGRSEETFDAGIQRGVERILAAPSFLFRIVRPPSAPVGASASSHSATADKPERRAFRLSDLDLASRLAFFLWSSIPDEELLNAAIKGQLSDPKVIEKQVRRMLRDDRAEALVNGFATRWLELSKLAGMVPDTHLYPEFDENLRDAMGEETQLFVGHQIREDRPVTELLSANYTFANERLAEHYGIPNIYGSHFRRVSFSDASRGGLLGQGSLLTVTSYPNRTSVVMRGRWLLANLLGSPPPPPPLDVPALKEPGADGQPKSLRERMELHRKNPACASCHQRMDPLGFALENFDAVGKWRLEADGAPVDPEAALPDGSRFNGADGLRAFLLSNKEDFVRTLSGKLLAYAIGRGVEHYDQPAIRKIARDAARSDYRWSSVVLGVVNSTPFSMGMRSEQ
jgi:mono/diheme cytochrome c family protein